MYRRGHGRRARGHGRRARGHRKRSLLGSSLMLRSRGLRRAQRRADVLCGQIGLLRQAPKPCWEYAVELMEEVDQDRDMEWSLDSQT